MSISTLEAIKAHNQFAHLNRSEGLAALAAARAHFQHLDAAKAIRISPRPEIVHNVIEWRRMESGDDAKGATEVEIVLDGRTCRTFVEASRIIRRIEVGLGILVDRALEPLRQPGLTEIWYGFIHREMVGDPMESWDTKCKIVFTYRIDHYKPLPE